MRLLRLCFAAALGLAALAGACSDDADDADDADDGGGGSGGNGAAGPGGAGPGGGSHTCNNGVLEAGEACDPCTPIDCFAEPAACVTSTLVIDEQTCEPSCVEEPITTCGADGCCSGSCADDPDCVCDASPDCNSCFECAEAGPCEAAVSACESSPDCIEYTNCTNACADDACVQACQQAATPDAVAAFEAWFSCLLCDECVVSCGGFGNPAFPGCN